MTRRPQGRRRVAKSRLDAMIEEATTDCYDEEEQRGGFFNMLEEHLKLPFTTSMLGVEVTVERLDYSGGGDLVAICSREGNSIPVPIVDLPLPAKPPKGAEWIDAYRRFCGA